MAHISRESTLSNSKESETNKEWLQNGLKNQITYFRWKAERKAKIVCFDN